MSRLRGYLPSVLLFVLVLATWEMVVRAFNIQRFLLPAPSVIAGTLREQLGVVTAAGLYTLREAVIGLGLGTILGSLAAFAISRWTLAREGMLPFAIAVNSAPIVALAPIANQWFGLTSIWSKAAIVTVMVFFPVMINMVRGLTDVEAGKLELMRSVAATPLRTIGKVRLPNALPYLFSALKVAAALSLIGAIVSEYFGGAGGSLGYYISQQAGLTRMAAAWSGVVVAVVMGALLNLIVSWSERRLMPWHVSVRT